MRIWTGDQECIHVTHGKVNFGFFPDALNGSNATLVLECRHVMLLCCGGIVTNSLTVWINGLLYLGSNVVA